jgi:monofunctional biosynthetic peptidoglycan transglycosylase
MSAPDTPAVQPPDSIVVGVPENLIQQASDPDSVRQETEEVKASGDASDSSQSGN